MNSVPSWSLIPVLDVWEASIFFLGPSPLCRPYVKSSTWHHNDYPYSYGFSSCTCFYEWLSISLWMGFCHAHFCTNYYPFLLNGFSSCTFLYQWLSISFYMGFCHAHFCTNDCPFILNGLSSWTFMYEWLPFLFELIVAMQISVRMTTISFWMDCRRAHFCTNDYHLFLNGLSSCTFMF